ncbi:unnamed protein product [Owenia fusiformis]|uniref:Uncharacterized protein n=1 Tax=Owenia fusiformis TaxID=6347 RepID=A0A8J1XGC6_OWEFU|nr:unnamed protein product [Owenia fusiformis]
MESQTRWFLLSNLIFVHLASSDAFVGECGCSFKEWNCSIIQSSTQECDYKRVGPGKTYPGDPKDLKYSIEPGKEQFVKLNISWQPPGDGSITFLKGFLVKVIYVDNLNKGKDECAVIAWTEQLNIQQKKIRFQYNCLSILKGSCIAISVTSLPKSTDGDDMTDQTIYLDGIDVGGIDQEFPDLKLKVANISSNGTIRVEFTPPSKDLTPSYTLLLMDSAGKNPIKTEKLKKPTTVHTFTNVAPGRYTIWLKPSPSPNCPEPYSQCLTLQGSCAECETSHSHEFNIYPPPLVPTPPPIETKPKDPSMPIYDVTPLPVAYTSPPSDSQPLGTMVILGIIAGVLVVISCLIGGAVCWYRKKIHDATTILSDSSIPQATESYLDDDVALLPCSLARPKVIIVYYPDTALHVKAVDKLSTFLNTCCSINCSTLPRTNGTTGSYEGQTVKSIAQMDKIIVVNSEGAKCEFYAEDESQSSVAFKEALGYILTLTDDVIRSKVVMCRFEYTSPQNVLDDLMFYTFDNAIPQDINKFLQHLQQSNIGQRDSPFSDQYRDTRVNLHDTPQGVDLLKAIKDVTNTLQTLDSQTRSDVGDQLNSIDSAYISWNVNEPYWEKTQWKEPKLTDHEDNLSWHTDPGWDQDSNVNSDLYKWSPKPPRAV